MVTGRGSLEEESKGARAGGIGLPSSVAGVAGRRPLKVSEIRVAGDSAFGGRVLLQSLRGSRESWIDLKQLRSLDMMPGVSNFFPLAPEWDIRILSRDT
jgi:hypothetical protein